MYAPKNNTDDGDENSGDDGSGIFDDLNTHCHYEEQVSGFIIFLYLNFGLMFLLPLGVSFYDSLLDCCKIIILRNCV